MSSHNTAIPHDIKFQAFQENVELLTSPTNDFSTHHAAGGGREIIPLLVSCDSGISMFYLTEYKEVTRNFYYAI